MVHRLVITYTQSVYFAVRAEALKIIHVYLRPESVNGARVSVTLLRLSACQRRQNKDVDFHKLPT